MSYERIELVTIGEQFDPQLLRSWCVGLIRCARADLPRLQPRGIVEETLRSIEVSLEQVEDLRLQRERSAEKFPPLTVRRLAAIERAIDWRTELTGLACAVFENDPDALARLRIGATANRTISKLHAEISQIIGALNAQVTAFSGVGLSRAFIQRGQDVLHALEEVQRCQPEEYAQTPASLTALYHAMGVLYTRARFLARVASVEFRNEPDRRTRYSSDALTRPSAS